MAAAIGLACPAWAGTIALQSPAPLVGNQNFSGPMGMDFDVVCSPILVTQLGAFDANQDGMKRTISVYIFDRDTQAAVAGPVQFAPGDDGTLVDGSRFKPLPTPVLLPGGFHGCIVAENYGAEELVRNSFAPVVFSTIDTGGGLIEFVGSSRYQSPVVFGVFPNTPDAGPANKYHAGTFEFELGPGPAITVPPLSQTVPDGTDAMFSVTASGAEPLTYQWQLNGVDLAFETDSTLTLLNVTAAEAGVYRVKVQDAGGALRCLEANLVVAPPSPVLAFDASTITVASSDPEGYAPGIANYFNVVAGTSIQVTDLGTVLFQASLTNTLTVQLFNLANASVLATVTLDDTDVSTPLASTPALSLFLRPLAAPLALGPGSYAVALYGTTAGAQYARNPQGITVASGIKLTGSAYASLGGPGVVPEVQDGTGFSYLAGTFRMTVSGAPIISQQPQGGNFAPGATVTLTVQAGGSLPLQYQWYQGPTPLSGATGPALALNNIGSLEAGDYTVEVSNERGSVTSAVASLFVAGAPTVDIALHAGIQIEGTVGLHYRVEYREALDPPDAWQLLQDLPALPASPYVIYDPTPATQPRRFYRVVLIP